MPVRLRRRRHYYFASFSLRNVSDTLDDRVYGDVVQRNELGDRVFESGPTVIYPGHERLS